MKCGSKKRRRTRRIYQPDLLGKKRAGWRWKQVLTPRCEGLFPTPAGPFLAYLVTESTEAIVTTQSRATPRRSRSRCSFILPADRTLRRMLNCFGFRLRRVQKTRPVKKIKETGAVFANVARANRTVRRLIVQHFSVFPNRVNPSQYTRRQRRGASVRPEMGHCGVELGQLPSPVTAIPLCHVAVDPIRHPNAPICRSGW